MPDNLDDLGVIDQLGGERLEGSGFEAEVPQDESEWRDPR